MIGKMLIRQFKTDEKNDVIQLWYECGLLHPPNDPVDEIKVKTNFQPELFLVGEIDDKIMATIMLGFEGRRGWINYLCILPRYQGMGYGSELVQHGMEVLRNLGAPKINLLIRPTNTKVKAFYKKLGFEIEDAVLMSHRFKKEN
ncbi:MAG: GNAT family acetyltransferase [Clostridiales bacterium]|nr:GNAT family acetyltransferase [Clostridiales bacterium]